MPRRPREGSGGIVYHVLNRAVGRMKLFKNEDDYAAFERVLEETYERTQMRLLVPLPAAAGSGTFIVVLTMWNRVMSQLRKSADGKQTSKATEALRHSRGLRRGQVLCSVFRQVQHCWTQQA